MIKKLIIVIILSIFCFGFTIQDMHKAVIARKNASAVDLMDSSNAVSKTNEADATTDWVEQNSPTFSSQEVTVDNGTSAFEIIATGAGEGALVDLDNYITATQNVLLKFRARHTGSGGTFNCGLSSTNYIDDPLGITIQGFSSGDTTWASYQYLIENYGASHRYFGCRENSITNDGGVYFDAFELILQ